VIRARAVQMLCGVIFVTTAQRMAAQNATIEGQTVLQGGALTIGYAVVNTTPGGHEQFSDADGRFVIRDLHPGTVHLTARRIGYAPFDTAIDLHAGERLRVRLEMRLITIQLPAVHTLAKACAHPGGSSDLIGPDLALLFDQVRQNAERNRLLASTHPFELSIERRITKPEPILDARFVAYDTVRRSGLRDWRYAPGHMLGTREIESGVFGGKWITLTMPELADFADPTFLDNHCFDYAGLESVDGDTLIAVDFRPAPVVRQPDVSGTLFLDPRTYQLRLTLVTLVNLTKNLEDQISGQAVRATFKEILPGVPVLDVVSSAVFPKIDPKKAATEPATETQRTLSVRFLNGRPR